MPDNPPQSSVWWSVFYRSVLVFVATCITICIAIAVIPVLFVMFILVAVSPESFSNLSIGGDTVRIRLDLNVTYGPQRAPRQRTRAHGTSPRPTSPQDNQLSSPQSPSTPAYSWARQYNSQPSAPLGTTFAVQQPYTWRSTSGYVPSHANIYNSMPPYLPPISEPGPRPLFPQYGAYTSMDPSPPFRASRLVRTNSNVSWTADDRLPPARPDDTTTPTPSGARRRSTAESMPGLVPIVNDESDDEILPVYDRPPEYDDERHSQPSSR
ncbi:hypothetical protein E4T50_04972 [Aureobasidium sp. EXF-12298]|nr:hypothetical protein E4T50_04972 [Aureobasidium sp. EXF-12298]KAI4762268.1 hypothetical protein E4T51_04750 [Aureobasidium sp. EXF-12344]KAI4774403.1 hypothetical protein E4T52_10631 [Aureobasidium sp. EXF-3400]